MDNNGVKGLKAIAQTMADFRANANNENNTKMPAGPKNQTVENQVTEMDMIAGICSAAFFGSANRNRTNFQTLLSNPNKSSYLGQIYQLLTVSANKSNEIILDKKSIKVTLVGIDEKLKELFIPFLNNSNSESNASSLININVNGITNIKELNNELYKLAAASNDPGLIDGLIGLFNTIQEINKLNSIDTANIIQSVKSIGELSTQFTEIDKIGIINDETIKNISESCEGISKIIESINKIPVKPQNLEIFNNDNLHNIINGLSSINEFVSDENLVINYEAIQNMVSSCEGISKIIENINKIPEDISNATIFDEGGDVYHIINGLSKVTELISSDKNLSSKNINELFKNINFNLLIDNFANTNFKNLDDAIKNIDILHNFLNNEGQDSLMVIFEDLDRIINIIHSSKSENSIEDVSKILDSIFKLIKFDGKIDKDALDQIRSITKEDGILDKLFKDLKNLQAKDIDKEIKSISTFVNSLKVLSQIDIKQLNNFIKTFKKLINQIIVLGKSNNEIGSGFEILGTSLEKLKPIIDGYAKLDLESIKNIASLMHEINNFVLITGLVFIAISYCVKYISIKTLSAYLFYTGVLLFEIIGFMYLASKINSEKLTELISIMKELEKFILLSSLVFVIINLVGKFVNGKNVLNYGLLMAGLLFMTNRIINLLAKYSDKLNNAKESLKGLSIFIATTSAVLMMASLIGRNYDILNLITFEMLLTTLIFMVGNVIKLMQTTTDKKMLDINKEFGILVLSLGASLALGSWIAQSVQIDTIIYFGLLLSLMIAAVSLPLAALSIRGKIAIQGAADLGKLILYATAGMLLGAWFIEDETRKKAVKEFIWIYLGFIGGIIIAVGLAAFLSGGKSLEAIDGLYKIILWSTACLFIGAAIFWKWPDIKESVWIFGATLVGFIGLISLAVGGAIKLMEGTEDAKWILLELMGIIVISGTMMILAGHFLKDIDTNILWTFTWASIVLVGGISLIVGLLVKNVSEEQAKQGVLLLGTIALTIGILGLAMGNVLKYAKDVKNPNIIWDFAIASIILVGGIVGIMYLIKDIKLKEILKSVIAIGVAGLLIVGLGYVFEKIYKVLEKSVSPECMWQFVFQSLVLLGGIILLIKIAGSISFTKMLVGLAAIAFAGLIVLGLSYVFGLMYDKLLRYDKVVGKMWAVSMSMLGIVAVYMLAMAGIGFLMLGGGAILVGAGFISIALTGLIIWGMTEVFDNLLEADSRLKLSQNSGEGSPVWKATDGLFNIIQHVMDRVKGLDTGMFELPDWLKNTPVIGTLASGLNSVIGAVFSIPSLISVGFAMITLYLSTVAIKGVCDLIAEADIENLNAAGGPIDNVFDVISHIVQRMINLNKDKDKISDKKDGGGFIDKLSSFAGGILDIISNILSAGSNMLILGMALFTLYGASVALEKLNQIFIDDAALKAIMKKVDMLFEVIQTCVTKIININTSVPDEERSLLGKAMDFVGVGKIADAGNAIANAGVVGMAIMALTGIVNLVTTMNEAFPNENVLNSFKTKVDTLCVTIQSIVDTLVNLETSNKDTKYELPLVGDVTGVVKLADKFMGGENDITKNTNTVTATLATLHKMIKQIIEIDKIFPKTESLTKIKTNTKSLCSTINEIMVKLSELNAPQHKAINFGENKIAKFAGKIAGNIVGEISNNNTINKIINSLKSLNAIINEIDKLNKNNDKINTTKISTNIQSILQIINNLDTTKVDNNILFGKYILSLKEWINAISYVNITDMESKTNILSQSITKLFDIMASQHENKLADHVETIKKYVDSINAVDVSKVESMTNLAFAVTNLGNKIGNIDKFTEVLATKIANVLAKLSQEMNFASNIIKQADNLHKQRQNAIKDSITKITELMDKEMIVKIENEQPSQESTGSNDSSVDTGGENNNNSTGNTNDSTLDTMSTPPVNQNSEIKNSSGGSQKISADINVDRLASAIVIALKKTGLVH